MRTRKIIYWQSVASKERPWATFTIVPSTELPESIFLDEQIRFIKAAGFNYKVIETVETILEEG